MAIYARLENGTYAEVTGVYKADGTEVTEIFQSDRLVYSASNEIYGALPLYYNGKGYDLTDYLISGNTVQDGTPSPEDPVDATGSGVRTGNLFDKSTDIIPGVIRDNTNDFGGINLGNSILFLHDGPAETYTVTRIFGFNLKVGEFDSYPKVGDVANVLAAIKSGTTVTFTTSPGKKYIDIYFWQINAPNTLEETAASVMLNLGSTALPYEPYGYKLPLTVNGAEYPIYPGQVETTRRVKKLVLTGEETWSYSPVSGTRRFSAPLYSTADRNFAFSTHYRNEISNTDGAFYHNSNLNSMQVFFVDERFDDVAGFKSYLAAQYAAGTPVTIWYVLAEPETAVVNEPLHKIGDYADTVSFAQAGVAIPTVNGANVLDMASSVKPSEVYVKGNGIKPMDYGQLVDVNGVNILDKDGRSIYVHGQ